MYFGCHDGMRCAISGLWSRATTSMACGRQIREIGYGLQVKLNSVGVIRDNVIMDTKGPGIMVYGARMPDRVSVVERNVVMGSLRSSGIVVGGGPVIVRNNVVIGNREGGHRARGLRPTRAAARGHRGPQHDLWQSGRRHHGARPRAAGGGADQQCRSTRPWAPSPFPAGRVGTMRRAMSTVSMALCFENPQLHDFSPAPGSPLPHGGIAAVEAWMPTEDLFGAPRRGLPTAGAIEGPHGPLPLPVRP